MFRKKMVILKQYLTIKRQFYSEIRNFSEIPSPTAWPILGHLLLFIGNGPYQTERLTEAAEDLALKYGSIFRLKFPGQEFIVTVDADDTSILFQQEGKYPNRPTSRALAYYRQVTFGTTGVVPGCGEEWYKFRKALSPLLKKSFLRSYLNEHQNIALDFVKFIKRHKDSNSVVTDVFSHMMKYTTEAISIISPGIRMKCLQEKVDSRANEIINANCLFMDGLYRTYSEPPLWKIIKTNGYKNLECGHTVIQSMMNKELQKISSGNLVNKENKYMNFLFEESGLSLKDACLLATEVFLSGIDATATTLAMTLYYLSQDEERQELAYKDALLGPQVTQPYLRACIKETLRMASTAGGNSRSLPKDVVMSGYHVPANTTIIAFNSVTSCMDKYFVDPRLYKPERWLRDSNYTKEEIHPFSYLPFGHGPRMCPGRWLAEQEMLTLLTEILKEFNLECQVNNVGMIYRMNRIPDKLINLKFIQRLS